MTVLLCLCIAFALTACDRDKDDEGKPTSDKVTAVETVSEKPSDSEADTGESIPYTEKPDEASEKGTDASTERITDADTKASGESESSGQSKPDGNDTSAPDTIANTSKTTEVQTEPPAPVSDPQTGDEDSTGIILPTIDI